MESFRGVVGFTARQPHKSLEIAISAAAAQPAGRAGVRKIPATGLQLE
jgi:hypothetical protein